MISEISLRAPLVDDAEVLTVWENIDGDEHISHADMLRFISENQRLIPHGQQRFVIDSKGTAVGTVDLSNPTADNTAAYVSIFIAPHYRSKGVATKALNMLVCKAIAMHIRRLGAIINNDNILSQALFTAAGFVPVADCLDFKNATVWMLDIATRHVENNA